MLIGAIGDDFTGSSDLANTLAQAGMRTVQYCNTPTIPAGAEVEAGVVALKTRSVPVAEAVTKSLAALEWLLAQGCQQILFKYCSTFDSTPEGNIGPVTAALADRLAARRVVVCPAFPGTGRTLYMGHLFVGDRLLSESGMQHHPLTPMTDPDIRRWLGRQTIQHIGHVPHHVVREGAEDIRRDLARQDAEGTRLIVVDALDEADLLAIGAACKGLPLVTGGSGIAIGLPANFGKRAGDAPAWDGVTGPCVILAGSCSRMTLAQVAHHAERHPTLALSIDEILTGRQTPQAVADWVTAQNGLPLVHSGGTPEALAEVRAHHGSAVAAEAVETFLSRLAQMLVASGVQRLVTAGGETSSAVTEALSLTELQIGPEIAPGVPALRAGELALALKSGNFGQEDFFERAAERLQS